jgi:hypothetical protein
MKYLFFVASVFFGFVSKADIIGSVWVGQPKIAIDETMLCSPDPQDKPRWEPSPYGTAYLKITKWNDGWFRIEEEDNCSSWFGFDSVEYVYQQQGSKLLDLSGKVVGTVTATSIDISNSGAHSTKIIQMKIEIQADGNAKFYAKFTNDAANKYYPPPGIFEQSGVYTPYQGIH